MAAVPKPELVWIEGRCYRVNEPNADLGAFQEHDLYENETTYQDVEDEDEDEKYEITVLENGRFCTKFHVSQHYLGSVIGKKAIVKRKIESDTRTEIKIPKHGQDGDVVVLGATAACTIPVALLTPIERDYSVMSVKTARRRINMIVIATRLKQRPTHFISIPMNSTPIVDSFNKFKDEIVQEQCDRGLDESMFIESSKLHLTLCVMSLMDNEERRIASELLTEARDTIILPALQGAPLRVAARGVSYMSEDPREVRVLYAGAAEAGQGDRLQAIADRVSGHFIRAGFAKREYDRDSVKLHMTLINTRYAKGSTEEAEDGTSKWSPRKHFDASRILEKYAQLEFGEQTVTEVHLSQMHAAGADGYYQPTCVVSLAGSLEA